VIARVILFAVFVILGTMLYRTWKKAAAATTCERCLGKGYWHGTRERVYCDECGGSGEITS